MSEQFDITKMKPSQARGRRKTYRNHEEVIREKPLDEEAEHIQHEEQLGHEEEDKHLVVHNNQLTDTSKDQSLQAQGKRLEMYEKDFKKREKLFQDRIKKEKWGQFNVSFIVDKLYDLGVALNGVRPYPYQEPFIKRIFLSVLLNEGEEISACFSRQSGKTEAVAFAINTLSTFLAPLSEVFPQLEGFKHGLRVGIYGGSGQQVSNIMERIQSRMAGEPAREILSDPDISQRFMNDEWSCGSYVYGQSAAKQTKIESKTFDIIVCEECQDIDEMKINKSIHPMLAATNGTLVKIGTPIPQVCEFYKALMRGKRRDIDRPRSRKTVYIVDYREVEKWNPKYRKYIQLEKERIGESSDAFRMAYGVEWILEKGMVITPDQFEMKLESPRHSLGDFNHELVIAGVDLGKEVNSTVVTMIGVTPITVFRDGFQEVKFEHRILDWLELVGQDWDEQISHIKYFCSKYPNLRMVGFDATGVGSGIYDLIRQYFLKSGVKPVPVKFTVNLKAEMAELFDLLVNDGLIRIPAHPSAKKTRRWQKFFYQLIECERVYKQGRMLFQKSGDSGAMDDYVDSFLIGLYIAKQKLQMASAHSGVDLLGKNSLFRDQAPKNFSEIRRRAQARAGSNVVNRMLQRFK